MVTLGQARRGYRKYRARRRMKGGHIQSRFGRRGLGRRRGAPKYFKRGYHRRSGYYGRYKGGGCSMAKEKKFLDTVWSSAAISTTWTDPANDAGNDSLNIVAQGVDKDERIGRKLCVHNVSFRGEIHCASGTSLTANHNRVRICLILDRQCNGANATMADIFEPAAVGIDAWRNLANQERFTILWSKTLVFNKGASSIAGPLHFTTDAIKKIGFSKKMEVIIEYDGATGAITTIQSNNLFFAVCARLSTPACTLTGRARVRWSD